jgi:hypothetical protein
MFARDRSSPVAAQRRDIRVGRYRCGPIPRPTRMSLLRAKVSAKVALSR